MAILDGDPGVGVRRPTDALLRENPLFRQLWACVVNALQSPASGLLRHDADNLQTARQELAKQRRSYLQEVALWTEIVEWVEDAQCAVDIEGQELSPEDLKLLYSVRTSLQVAAAAQGLRLPAPSCTSTARAACGQHVQAQGADSVCSSLAGTTDHILGITGQQLVLRNLQVNEAKRTNALLTPILEQRLADRTRMLYEWCIDDEMCCEPDADVPKAIEKHMVSKVAAIAASWPANQSAVLNVAKNYKECMDQQVEAWRNLKGIIDHHVHGSEIECYKAQLDCLESQLETTGKLVERCDAELKEVTYTTDSVQALQKVSEVLDAEESTLHARLNQLQVQLQQYQNLGEPMMGVAQEYQKIRGQVEETKHTVDQFNMLLSELDEQKEGMSP